MAKCECLDECPFFNDKMKDPEGVKAIYKQRYCRGDNARCARYMVWKELGEEAVPIDLYPYMHGEADEILAKG